jgi:hypothetical protein
MNLEPPADFAPKFLFELEKEKGASHL